MTPLIRINTELITRRLAAIVSVASGWHGPRRHPQKSSGSNRAGG
jgi:hypothetical protein